MALALRLGLVQLATIGIARGGRVASRDLLLGASSELAATAGGEGRRKERSGANQSSLAELGPEPDIPDVDVDFAFMTHNFRYPGHEPGVTGTVNEWFGGRTVGDGVKEELVQGHICQGKGDREQTYYATSMCYWLPEIKQDGQLQDGQRQPLLLWKGGKYVKGSKSLCGGLTGSGVCAKCSVCHNNARNEFGAVEHVNFVERLELPDGCLGEKEIERMCIRQFEEGSPDMKAEHARCNQLEERFSNATKELAECDAAMQHLPQKVEHGLPQDLDRARRELYKRGAELSAAQSTERAGLESTKTACSAYYSISQGWMFAEGLMGATSTSQLLDMMSHTCTRPAPPTGPDGYLAPGHSLDQYHKKMEEYSKCTACDDNERALRMTNAATNKAQVVYTHAQGRVSTLQQELAKVKRDLELWQAKRPGLQTTKNEAEKAWLPDEKGCRATHTDYTTGLASSVADCALNLYEPSCEKACLELQAGCGVMEGDRPGSVSGKGGVEAPCTPPEPSWIQGPYTYGATEPAGGQCERIRRAQMWDPRVPRYSQKVLKTGWLWKQGRASIFSSGWSKRFFVLESSNAVRSAVLRYYHADPSRTATLDESNGKGIILWDAKGIKSKNGEHYGWKNGEECFKIHHFYRSYTLCVPRDSRAPIDRQVRHGETVNTRDEWMDLISDEITHPAS